MKKRLQPIIDGEKVASYAQRVTQLGKESHLLPTHVSLYLGLFVCWQRNNLVSPFQVSRRLLMSYSRIASTATYHKCIKELHNLGYIRYQPSYHPTKCSLVYWPDENSIQNLL